MRKSKSKNRLLVMLKAIGCGRLATTIIGGSVVAYLSFALAVSGIARIKSPQLALMVFPNESAALASRADQLFFSRANRPPANVQKLALAAAYQQPINSKALRLLGYLAELRQNPQRAEKLVTLAARLSRREPGAQLWLIENTALNGSTADTLRHYDILLRTKPDTSVVLYPRLLNAIQDADVRANLALYMRLKRSWVTSFLDYALANSKDLPTLNALLVENGGFPKMGALKTQTEQLLSRLTAEKQFAEARALYLTIPQSSSARLRNLAFDRFDVDGRFGAMGWVINDAADAAFDVDAKAPNKGPTLSFSVAPVTTSVIATRLLFLPPGEYTFNALISTLQLDNGGTLQWQIRCVAQNGTAAFWSTLAAAKSVSSQFTVASDCPVQTLEIVGSGGNGQAGMEAVISDMSIAPRTRVANPTINP